MKVTDQPEPQVYHEERGNWEYIVSHTLHLFCNWGLDLILDSVFALMIRRTCGIQETKRENIIATSLSCVLPKLHNWIWHSVWNDVTNVRKVDTSRKGICWYYDPYKRIRFLELGENPLVVLFIHLTVEGFHHQKLMISKHLITVCLLPKFLKYSLKEVAYIDGTPDIKRELNAKIRMNNHIIYDKMNFLMGEELLVRYFSWWPCSCQEQHWMGKRPDSSMYIIW